MDGRRAVIVTAEKPARRGVLAAKRRAMRDEIARRKKENQTNRQIADALGLKITSLYRICYDYNIKKGIGYVD